MEKQIFFMNKNGNKLFGTLFTPETGLKARGVVICQPIAEERCRSKRVLVNQARSLCDKGCHVLLFDYYGEGDSEGNFEETSAMTRISDICDGVNFLGAATGISDIGTLGLRMGASLGLLASQQANLSFCVLWEPVIDGRKYMQDWLKVNLSAQLFLRKEIKYNREVLESQILQGATIENEGYIITKDFYTSLAQLNLSDIEFPKIPILVLGISSLPAKRITQPISPWENNGKLSYLAVKERRFWDSYKIYNPNPPELINLTSSFIAQPVSSH